MPDKISDLERRLIDDRLRSGKPSVDKARIKKEVRAEKASRSVRDRRRFKTTPVPMGDPGKPITADHLSSISGATIFPTRVFDVGDENVLKDGSSNSKIGGDVLKGALKGARIVTLTLQERATCPRSCGLWNECYGNSMQYARRWKHGADLEAKIEKEVAELCAAHPAVLVRLHVLGDFYSVDYALHWALLLRTHENLHVFGFTAHLPASEIGQAVGHMRDEFGLRFSMRHSGMTGPWGSFTLDFPTEQKRIGDAVVCPEQRDGMNGGREGRHCGNCTLCWADEDGVPIAFVIH